MEDPKANHDSTIQDQYAGMDSRAVEMVFADANRQDERAKMSQQTKAPISTDNNATSEKKATSEKNATSGNTTTSGSNATSGNNTSGADNGALTDLMDLPAPLPLSRGERAMGRTHIALPGAVSIPGNPNDPPRLSVSGNEENGGGQTAITNPVPAQDNGDDGLAVANLVEEGHIHTAVHQSENADSREENDKKIKTYAFLGIIVLMAITIIIIAVSVQKNPSETDEVVMVDNNVSTTKSPTEAPTYSLEGFILSLLPDSTVQALGDPSSPQGLAWDWLLEEDKEILSSLSEDHIKQKFALVTLYYATGGDTWRINDRWLNHSVSECEWYNLPDFSMKASVSSLYPNFLDGYMETPPEGQCNEAGLYEHLWLDANNLKGSLPEELFMMTSLKTLSTIFNSLQGQTSTLFGKMTNLEGLMIAYTKNAGTIPTEFGLLTNMQVMTLADSNHHGTIPSELWSLTNLDTCDLARNRDLRGTIPTSIALVTNLRYFCVEETRISGTIPTEIGQLSRLEWLTGFYNELSGTFPSELGMLSTMLFLIIYNNTLITGTLPTELGKMTAITSLRMWGNQLTGTIPSELGLMTEMSISLSFKDNQFTGTIPTEMGNLLKSRELEFRENQLTGPIPSELGRLSTVEHLTFADNYLSGTIPSELAALSETLHTLTFFGNPLLFGSIPEAACHINGSCVSIPQDACNFFHVNGLRFDCSPEDGLCGCEDCPCEGATTGSNNSSNFTQ